LILEDVRLDRRQFEELVTQRPRVLSSQGVAAAPAFRRFAGLNIVGGQQRRRMRFVSALTAAGTFRALTRRTAFDVWKIAGGRLRGIARILAEPLLQLLDALLKSGDPLFVPPHNNQQRRLNRRRDLIPQFLGNSRLRPHAAVIENCTESGKDGA
jgi:hypothetical protein